MNKTWNKSIVSILLFVMLAIIFTVTDKYINGSTIPEGFASGNGRLEAKEFDIASKLPGRIAEVLVQEGDQVEANQILALLDTRASAFVPPNVSWRMLRRCFALFFTRSGNVPA